MFRSLNSEICQKIKVMITRIKELPDNMVGFLATDEVSAKDFIDVVMPEVEKFIEKKDKLNYMLVIETDLSKFTAGAWFQAAKPDPPPAPRAPPPRRKLRRCARAGTARRSDLRASVRSDRGATLLPAGRPCCRRRGRGLEAQHRSQRTDLRSTRLRSRVPGTCPARCEGDSPTPPRPSLTRTRPTARTRRTRCSCAPTR